MPVIRFFAFSLFLWIASAPLFAQQNRLWVQMPDYAACGDSLTVRVMGSFQTPILGLQYSINWDTVQAKYLSHTEPALNGDLPLVNALQADSGIISYLWLTFNSATPLDSFVLMEIVIQAQTEGWLTFELTDIPVQITAVTETFATIFPPNDLQIAKDSTLLVDYFRRCNSNYTTIEGQVLRSDAIPVADVKMTLEYRLPGFPVQTEVAYTAANGAYSFSQKVPKGVQCSVRPALTTDPLNGVNTWDVYLLRQHISGAQPLGDPYLLLAADINRSDNINSQDALDLLRMLLGFYTQFPNNDSWRFVRSDLVFPNPSAPFGAAASGDFWENLQIQNLLYEVNFTAVKVGDLDLNVVSND